MKECGATMLSHADEDHVHYCSREHKGNDHHCAECGRWFFTS